MTFFNFKHEIANFILHYLPVKPILRSFLFGLIVIFVFSVISEFDGDSVFSDDEAFIYLSVVCLLFTLFTYPMYRAIDKNKRKNNKYKKIEFKVDGEKVNNYKDIKLKLTLKRKVSIKELNKKQIILLFIAFILGPFTLFLNCGLRLVFNKKKNECEKLEIFKKTGRKNSWYLVIQIVLLFCYGLIPISTNLVFLKVLCWVLSGIIGCLGVMSVTLIIELITSISHFVKTNQYFDLAGKYEIKAKECNAILYLKNKKIEDYSYNIEQQIILSYSLHQINAFYAIGIQKFSKFYILNLEEIYKQLDLKFSEEERRNISNVIANSYGNDKLDKFDLAIGSSIGLITGLMDIFLVGKPGESILQGSIDDLTEKTVRLAGKLNGFTDEDLSKVVAKLEKKYWVPYDKTTVSEINMTADNHHLQSLAHANDIVGLIFAILDIKLSINKTIENGGALYTVVTCTYSHDSETIEKIKENKNFEFIFGGSLVRLVQPLTYQSGAKKDIEKDITSLGKNVLYKSLYETCKDADEIKRTVMCIITGFVLWLGHLYSDKVGASSTVSKENRGSGIAAPFQELFIGAGPNISEKLSKVDSSVVEKKFKDCAKEMFTKGFDNRFFNTQKIPVLINEYLVKIVFIVKEIGINNKNLEFNDLMEILTPEGFTKDGVRLISGNSNFELQKTLLVSYSVFSIVDVGDAFISSGAVGPDGIVPNVDTFLSINYPGLIKLGQESVSVFLSYLHRWTDSPDKIVMKIEKVAMSTEHS